MKKLKWSVRAIVIVGLFQVVSCTKTVDTITNDSVSAEISDNLTFPVTNEFGNCKLRRIYHFAEDAGYITSGLFTYNNAGNPISLNYEKNDPGIFDYYFLYDKQQRLIEYGRQYRPGDWYQGEKHLYGYDFNNRIVTDTLIENPRLNDPEEYYELIWVSTLTYDVLGRVVKENIRNIKNYPGRPLEPARNPTYTYDARGNLAVAGWKSSSYDNKVSIFRSHPVFQLIFRNFSKNNAAPQAKYNSKGLPLSVKPGNDRFFNFTRDIEKAIYDCQ